MGWRRLSIVALYQVLRSIVSMTGKPVATGGVALYVERYAYVVIKGIDGDLCLEDITSVRMKDSWSATVLLLTDQSSSPLSPGGVSAVAGNIAVRNTGGRGPAGSDRSRHYYEDFIPVMLDQQVIHRLERPCSLSLFILNSHTLAKHRTGRQSRLLQAYNPWTLAMVE